MLFKLPSEIKCKNYPNYQMNKHKLQQTRGVIKYALDSNYIKGNVCDFGAGTAKYKSMIIKKSANYIATDVFPNENIDIVCDVEKSPLKDGEFDTVICTQVLEHTKHPWLVAQEIYRILKKDGIIIVTAPFLVPYHPDPEDNYRFTPSGMETLFKDAGFKILEADFYGNQYVVILEMFHFHFVNPYKKHGKIKNRIFSYLDKFFRFLDARSKGKVIFANTFLIAQKN